MTLSAVDGAAARVESHDAVVIACDGSCLGNPGPGGWSWAVSDLCWAAGGQARTTNNLMELRAAYEALSATPSDRPLVIETDSEYVINVFSLWLPGWKLRGWLTAARKPVMNRPAIEKVESRLHGREVTWRHVKGHAGHKLNEIVDQHAREAATATRDGLRVDSGVPDCIRGWLGG